MNTKLEEKRKSGSPADWKEPCIRRGDMGYLLLISEAEVCFEQWVMLIF